MDSIPLRSSSESSSDDSDDESKMPEKEKDPGSVEFKFLKTGKSSKEGVLITHGGHFKFSKNNYSRDGKTHWYTCSSKQSHGCTARAIIKREEFIGDDDELWVKNRLVEIATPEAHAKYHVPDQASIIADFIMVKIKQQIDQNPIVPVGRAKEAVLKDVYLEYENDPGLLADIISALPKKMESTLNLHKNRILGSLPKSRDDFDPSSLLSKLDGGEKIVVCDSNTDLPKNWRDIDLKEAFGSLGGDVPDLEANAASCLKDSSSTLCEACEPDVVNESVAPPCSPRPASVPSSSDASVPEAASASNCCAELLLSEGEVRFSCLPSYQGSERKFDERMAFLGFERSPSQPRTQGDGNCGVYGLLDQLNLPTSDPLPRFERDEALFARKYVITEMKSALRTGNIEEAFFWPNTVGYLSRMAKDFTFVDNLFLKFFAVLTKRDIIILPLHPESALVNREFTWIFGGGYNSEESGSECPLFLGYYEESHFLAPHYQSVVPTRDNTVLEMIRENDGYDVARQLGFQKLSAPGCPEPRVPVISTTSSSEPAATCPPEPSTPYSAYSATVSLEEASIQAEKTGSLDTPAPLFNPGANSTMLSLKRKRAESDGSFVMKIRRTATSWLIQDRGVSGPVHDDPVSLSPAPNLPPLRLRKTGSTNWSFLPKKRVDEKSAKRQYLEARGLLREDEPSPPPSSDEESPPRPKAPIQPAQRKSRMKGPKLIN